MKATDDARSPARTCIRIAAHADAAELAAFARRTFADAFEARNDPAHVCSYVEDAFSLERTQAELRDAGAVTFVQRLGEDLTGFARVLCGAVPDCVTARAPTELQRIYVDKRRAISGLGSQLLDAVLDHAVERSRDVLWLGVWEHNEGAQRFYRRRGFVAVGEQTFMLGPDRQRDIVMALSLAGADS